MRKVFGKVQHLTKLFTAYKKEGVLKVHHKVVGVTYQFCQIYFLDKYNLVTFFRLDDTVLPYCLRNFVPYCLCNTVYLIVCK